LGSKKTLSEALIEAFELEAADIAAGMSSRVQQIMARTFWKSQSLPAE
jgi:hypothetical protein